MAHDPPPDGTGEEGEDETQDPVASVETVQGAEQDGEEQKLTFADAPFASHSTFQPAT